MTNEELDRLEALRIASRPGYSGSADYGRALAAAAPGLLADARRLRDAVEKIEALEKVEAQLTFDERAMAIRQCLIILKGDPT